MKEKIKLFLPLLLVIGLLSGCGLPGDPLLDNLYTQNVYPGTASDYSVGFEDLPYSEGWFDDLHSDHIALGGVPLLIPAYGEMYLTATDLNYLTIVDTFYKTLDITISDELRDFTADSGRFTYIGDIPDRVCLVNCSLSVYPDRADVTLSTKLYINGEEYNPSLVMIELPVANKLHIVTINSLITLQPNDYIEIWMASHITSKLSILKADFVVTTVD